MLAESSILFMVDASEESTINNTCLHAQASFLDKIKDSIYTENSLNIKLIIGVNMDYGKKILNNLFVLMFNQILNIEEDTLKKGEFGNLTVSELHVIDAIGMEDVSPMTALATKLNITVGTLTISINNLVKKGYVERVRSEEDRRVVLISLTDLGRKAFVHHEKFHDEMISSAMSELEPEETIALIKALSKVTDYFKDLK